MRARQLLFRLSLWCSVGCTVSIFNYSAQAEGRTCPDGYYPIGGGSSGWVGCGPIPSAPMPNAPRYLPSYIAIAWHHQATDVWATWNHSTVDKAKQTALAACNNVMGSGCAIATAGADGSVAIARTRSDQLWYGWGETPKIAQKNVVGVCEQESPPCNVLHVFTTTRRVQLADGSHQPQALLNRPIDLSQDYFPNSSVGRRKPTAQPKRGFLGMAWVGNSKAAWQNVVVAAGYPTVKEAQTAAITRCEAESQEKCISFGNIDDGTLPYFGVYHDNKDNIAWYNHITEKQIEEMAMKDCRDRNVTCRKIGIFDARKSGMFIQSIPQ